MIRKFLLLCEICIYLKTNWVRRLSDPVGFEINLPSFEINLPGFEINVTVLSVNLSPPKKTKTNNNNNKN